MTETSGQVSPEYPPFDAAAFTAAMQLWQQGQQEPAKAQVQPAADSGNPRAAALMAWFLHQQGDPGWRAAIPYAEVAVKAGYVQAAGFVVGNMMTDPTLRARAVELAAQAAPFGINYLDPFNQAVAYAQQNDLAGVEAMLGQSWPLYPFDASQWREFLDQARASSAAIESMRHEAVSRQHDLTAAADDVSAFLQETRAAIDAQSEKLKTLITQTTNAQASSFFDTEATTAEGQAKLAWSVGLGVVAFAAVLSILPLLGHYSDLLFSHGAKLSSNQVLGAHVTAALALATVSGVLLTRSRVRDRNRQRNRDLSVALNTMFAYGEQIQDPADRQKFIHDMGRTVIEAYLQQEAGSSEDDFRSFISALASR